MELLAYLQLGVATRQGPPIAETCEGCATCPAICPQEGSPWARHAAVSRVLELTTVHAMPGWRPQHLQSRSCFCQVGKHLSRGWGWEQSSVHMHSLWRSVPSGRSQTRQFSWSWEKLLLQHSVVRCEVSFPTSRTCTWLHLGEAACSALGTVSRARICLPESAANARTLVCQAAKGSLLQTSAPSTPLEEKNMSTGN